MAIAEFLIYGKPEPKGSMRGFAKKVGTQYRGIVTHTDQSKKWERHIRENIDYIGEVFDGPLDVYLFFTFQRPKTVTRDRMSVKPDIDKLARAVLDALTGLVIKDDSRIVSLSARKEYDLHEGVYIRVSTVE